MEIFEKVGVLKSIKERIEESLLITEVTALVRYASEKGIVGHELPNMSKALCKYEKEKSLEAHQEMLEAYTHLVNLTKPMNGRILLENNKSKTYINILLILTIALIVLMLSNEVLVQWLGDQPEPEEGWLWYVDNFHRYILDFLSPFVWGAVGSCVFYLKKLYDLIQSGKFDSTKFHGWYLRILLGAILGFIVVYLYESSAWNDNEITIDSKALAFFAGLGVKVVYGAFERIVDVIAEKFSLGISK
jgi:hypothetical protein